MRDSSSFIKLTGCSEEDANYGKPSDIVMDSIELGGNAISSSTMMDISGFQNFHVNNLTMSNLQLTNTKLMFVQNGEVLNVSTVTLSGMNSAYILRKLAYPVYDFYNVTKVAIQQFSLSDAVFANYSTVLAIDSTVTAVFKSITTKNLQIGAAGAFLFSYVDNLEVTNLQHAQVTNM